MSGGSTEKGWQETAGSVPLLTATLMGMGPGPALAAAPHPWL